MIRFQAPQLPQVDDVAAYFVRAEDARWYSNNGPCHALLVRRLQRFLDSAFCVPVANATLGLMLGLRALVGVVGARRRKVLMPSFTFAAAINAVLWSGLEPVFLDVEERSWHLDPACLEHALAVRSGSVAAVLACSTFGVAPSGALCRAWEDAADAAGVPLLVDSAAGFGAVDDHGQLLGRQGDAEVFSFHATKPFAIGEGGLVTTTNEDVARRLRRLSNFGFEDGLVNDDVGLNAKLSEWSAATALAVLDNYADVVKRRRAAARRMLEELERHGYESQSGTEGAVWQFVPVLAPSTSVRWAALEAGRRDDIEIRTYFSVPLHRMPAFASVPIEGSLRCTEHLAERVLSLPMANDLSSRDVDAIIESLGDAVHAAST
jgi:dTDP-4-amino-4,6-dideoxygalactose transaminase